MKFKYTKLLAAAGMTILMTGFAFGNLNSCYEPAVGFSISANAADAPTSGTCGTNLKWKIVGNKLTISGTGTTIPDYDYEKSTAPWYNRRLDITTVELPKSLTKIGNYAFYNLNNLQSISLPSSLKTLGASCFEKCTSLTSIKFPKNLKTIPKEAFRSCSALKSANFNNINSIGDYAFYKTGLSDEIIFSTTMKKIGSNAFDGCKLAGITIQSGIIGQKAFSNCYSLTSITIKGGEISKNSFYYDSAVKIIDVRAEDISNGVFSGLKKIQEITLRSGTLKAGTISNLNALYKINFNGNVKLERYSISNCPKLNAITLSDVNTNYEWDNAAFNNCPDLNIINTVSATYSDPDTKMPYFNYDNFIRKYFNGCENVGFINKYVDLYSDYVVKTVITPNMTEVKKAKVLHDWVANKVDYDHNTKSDLRNHVESSIFINDLSVCEGYAKGYAILMNKAGVKTIIVGGMLDPNDESGHAWNMVKIGKTFFHVDCTHDDAGISNLGKNCIQYNKFLISDDELRHYCPNAQWTNAGTPAPISKYSFGNVDGKNRVSRDDSNLINMWLAGNATLDEGQRICADVDLDGRVTIADSIIIEGYEPFRNNITFGMYLASRIFKTW